MKKIEKLTLENFKFFMGEETLNFDSKNILVYGENGSGKSSLYWALYTFLQSSMKSDEQIRKYFDNSHPERLVNRFKADSDKSSIKLTLKNSLNISSAYKISIDTINTNKPQDTEISKANLTSDFINYRLLAKLYHFKNSQDIEIFDMFEDEILQYINIDGQNFNELWQRLKNGLSPRPKMTDQSYKEFQKDIQSFNEKFESYLHTLVRATNDILKDNFNEEIVVYIDYRDKAKYDDFEEGSTTKRNHITLPPKIYLTVEFLRDRHKIDKPHTFLNEARLTAIALSLRFAILKKRLSREDVLKVLVLDDLLISLDMSHRIEVINFILNDEDLRAYQIIVLTHDRGFFQLLRQKISSSEWKVFEFYNQDEKQCIKESKTEFEKAKELFENKDYEASANYLRKETEKILKHFLDPKLKCINKEFKNLEDLLNRVKNELEEDFRSEFNKIFKFKGLDAELLTKIDTDFENDTSLESEQKGLLRGLRAKLFRFTKKYHVYKTEEVQIFDELKRVKDRVMNPSSHNSEAPIFEQEVQEAIALISRLKEFLEKQESKKQIFNDIRHCANDANISTETSALPALIIDFEKDILENIKVITTTNELNEFLLTVIYENIEKLNQNELEKIFDELRFASKLALFDLDIEKNLIRIFTKKTWDLEEKKLWCSFVQYLFNRDKIKEPLFIQKLAEKQSLRQVWGGYNNQESWIDCNFLDRHINDEDIPF